MKKIIYTLLFILIMGLTTNNIAAQEGGKKSDTEVISDWNDVIVTKNSSEVKGLVLIDEAFPNYYLIQYLRY